MARVLFGVSGGIAAYKALETARLAVRAGHAVRVIQTEASTRFVGTASFAAITGAPVLIDDFEPDPARGAYPGEPVPDRAPISHLELVERADVYLIAPASANTLAKLAHGLADNLVSTAALAAACPVAVAPAMNARMYEHPATQANLRLLAERGVTVIGPGEGELASHGERGIGRLAEPAELLAACEALLAGPGPLSGRRVLVTAGGTREPIDSVRYVGNRSSGRMGLALAGEARHRGAEVTLIAANVTLAPPPRVRLIEVGTAAELLDACTQEFARCDVLLMAAAVADFRPAAPFAEKLKKDSDRGRAGLTLEFEATEDVLGALAARRRRDQIVVGFAAEHGEGALAYARAKRERKQLDAIVVNDISRPDIGFDVPENEVTILTDEGERRVPRASKAQVAGAILDEVGRLREREARAVDPREGRNGAAGATAGSAARV
ncbi:MAG TPA: bifunctional phosphopantothenoylcysteine decarboxylase/phosphopantothenate--cysteine ligase CoaBC [Solirubrobacteraceae bacterium]|nr:bifunctional phosphopantothenoylcysteine decarboxylase/phosphopantothenate--cysteine ligase CoaBC [Solirubrobacteraceae bacterium]